MKAISSAVLMGGLSLGLFLQAPVLQARECDGNSELMGSYGFVGARTLFNLSGIPPAGSAGSATAVARFVSGAIDTAPFSSSGRLFADGMGRLLISTTPTGLIGVDAGTYTVNFDCTVSMTVRSTQTVAGTGGAPSTTTTTSTTFEGVLLDNGNEIALAQTGTASGTILTLRRTFLADACANTDVIGDFGVVSSGATITQPTTGTTGTLTPFTLVGRFTADAGRFISEAAPGTTVPLPGHQITGTYTANVDCTGTAAMTTTATQLKPATSILWSSGPAGRL